MFNTIFTYDLSVEYISSRSRLSYRSIHNPSPDADFTTTFVSVKTSWEVFMCVNLAVMK